MDQAQAQWVTQTVNLKPGWNAVFLEAQPEPSDVDSVLGNLPIESAWQWNRGAQRIDFVQDAAELVPQSAEWLTYLPRNHPKVAVRNLLQVTAGRPLLINVSGSQAVTWSVVGSPVSLKTTWVPDSFNLVGLPLTIDSTHTFGSFFAGSRAHQGMRVMRLNTLGRWEAVDGAAQARERPEHGKAYWISIRGGSDFSSPLQVSTDQGAGIAFGGFLSEARLRAVNAGTEARAISVDLLGTATPPKGFLPLAGAVPLHAWQFSTASDGAGGITPSVSWRALAEIPATTVAPGQEYSLRLQVRRDLMAGPAATTPADAIYQTVLQVRDSLGARAFVPVSALSRPKIVSSATGAARSLASLSTPSSLHPKAGLWVGNVTIKAVNHTAHASDPSAPLPTASEFDFRILVHLDGKGQAKLLQMALLSWKLGQPDNPNQPGRYVLFTDEAKARAAGYVGATLRDGIPVPRRFSAPIFGFKEPLPMQALGDFGVGSLKCTVNLGYDDPVNPFVHRAHPDHDNLDEQNPPQPLPAGIESFNVSRAIELRFSKEDPESSKLPGWGDTRIGGQYFETVAGLHRLPLNASGVFVLQRATAIADLNDQL